MTLTPDKYLTSDHVLELVRILSLARPRFLRDTLLIELALHSGAREGELLRITRDDLIQKDRAVFISKPEKGSNKRVIPLPDDLFARLWDYAQTVKETEVQEKLTLTSRIGEITRRTEIRSGALLFPITTSRVRQIWMDYRPANRKFHALRHTFGRAMYAQTKDVRLVKTLLGHKSLANTMIYTEIEYEAHTVRKAIGL